jgi:hypothetical protein
VNHRGLQRALFRMQLDPGFAARLRAREPAAEGSTQLAGPELRWLRAADAAAVSADREGRRRAQLLRNVSGELALSLAAAREPGWLESFPASDRFHRAIARDESLPLAFAAHVAERAAGGPTILASLVALEAALVRARRELREAPADDRAALRLAPAAWLVELQDGTFAWASALRQALDRGASLPDPPRGLLPDGRESVLIASQAPARGSRLREVRAERLEPAVAAFLRRCADGLDAAGIAAFCRELGIESADVEGVIEEFEAEGVLLRAAH